MFPPENVCFTEKATVNCSIIIRSLVAKEISFLSSKVGHLCVAHVALAEPRPGRADDAEFFVETLRKCRKKAATSRLVNDVKSTEKAADNDDVDDVVGFVEKSFRTNRSKSEKCQSEKKVVNMLGFLYCNDLRNHYRECNHLYYSFSVNLCFTYRKNILS